MNLSRLLLQVKHRAGELSIDGVSPTRAEVAHSELYRECIVTVAEDLALHLQASEMRPKRVRRQRRLMNSDEVSRPTLIHRLTLARP